MAWFQYMLFDTDWMGREVYGGKVGEKAYDSGVHKGALGLMLNSVVLALMSLTVEPLGRFVGGVKWLWGIVNVILAVCMAMTVVITRAAEHERKNGVSAVGHPSVGVQVAALTFFSVLGVPLAVRFFLISYHACIWKLHFFLLMFRKCFLILFLFSLTISHFSDLEIPKKLLFPWYTKQYFSDLENI